MNEFLPVKMKVESKVVSGIIVFFSILKQRWNVTLRTYF